MRAPIGLLKPTAVAELFAPWFGKAGSNSPCRVRIACVTRLQSIFSRTEPLSRPSATSSGIVPQRAHQRIYDWRPTICARFLFAVPGRGCTQAKEGQR